MKKNTLNILLLSFIGLFLLLLILLLVVDVVTITPGVKIGLYNLNNLFVINLGSETKQMFDLISDVFLISSLLGIITIAILGFYQLITRKSLKKVDNNIISLGVFVVIAAIIWIVFDNLIIINYRPSYFEGKLEGSFPSTHVMLVTFTYLSISNFLNIQEKNKIFKYTYYGMSITAIIISVVGRLLSLNHWFTDILGGLIVGIILYIGFLLLIEKMNNVKKNN